MKQHPAQKQALDYLRRKGTEASLDQLKRRLQHSFADLEAILAPLDEVIARLRPAEDRWSVQEIVDHLLVSHQRGAEQVNALLAGRSPGAPIPVSLQSKDPMGKSWPRLRAELQELHQDFLALVEEFDPEMTLERTAPVAMLLKVPGEDGQTRLLEWVADLDWKAFLLVVPVHNREHIDQIRRTLDQFR